MYGIYGTFADRSFVHQTFSNVEIIGGTVFFFFYNHSNNGMTHFNLEMVVVEIGTMPHLPSIRRNTLAHEKVPTEPKEKIMKASSL